MPGAPGAIPPEIGRRYRSQSSADTTVLSAMVAMQGRPHHAETAPQSLDARVKRLEKTGRARKDL